MKLLHKLFLRESIERAKAAGVTGADIERYIKRHNLPAKMKLTQWRDMLDILATKTPVA